MTDRNFTLTLVVAFMIGVAVFTINPFDIAQVAKAIAMIGVAIVYGVMGWRAVGHNTAEARGYFTIATVYLLVGFVMIEPYQLLRGPEEPIRVELVWT